MPAPQVSVPPIRGAPEIAGGVRLSGAFAVTAADTAGESASARTSHVSGIVTSAAATVCAATVSIGAPSRSQR